MHMYSADCYRILKNWLTIKCTVKSRYGGTESSKKIKNFRLSTRRTNILLGFMICTMLCTGINRKSHEPTGTPAKFEKYFRDSVHAYLRLADRLWYKLTV